MWRSGERLGRARRRASRVATSWVPGSGSASPGPGIRAEARTPRARGPHVSDRRAQAPPGSSMKETRCHSWLIQRSPLTAAARVPAQAARAMSTFLVGLRMRSVDSQDIDQAVAEMVRVLGPHDSLDWQVRAGSLDWSCWKTAAHVAHDLLAYAGQVAARPTTAYLPFDLVIAPAVRTPLRRTLLVCLSETSNREQHGAPSGRGERMLPVTQTPNRGN